MKLDREVGRSDARLRRVRLGHRRLSMAPLAAVEQGQRPIAEEPARVDQRRHLCQHLLHELKARDRLAKLRSLSSVGDAGVQRLLPEAHAEEADVRAVGEPRERERAMRVARLAEYVRLRHPAIAEVQLAERTL